MSKRQIPQQPGQFTRTDMEHAAESAREMVAEDSVLQHLLNFLIVSRQLYMVGRSALDNEIKLNWEVDDPELIIQTLVMSGQHKANEAFKVLELQQSVLSEIIPVLDIFVRQAQETGHDIDEPTDGEADESGQSKWPQQSDEDGDVPGRDPGDATGGGSPVTGT